MKAFPLVGETHDRAHHEELKRITREIIEHAQAFKEKLDRKLDETVQPRK